MLDGNKKTKPQSVAMFIELWLVVIVAQTVGFLASAFETINSDDSQAIDQRPAGVSNALLYTSVGVITVLAVIFFGTLLVFFSAGFNQARVVLLVCSVAVVIDGIFSLTQSDYWFVVVPAVISAVAAGGAGWLAVQKTTTDFFVEMTQLRLAKK